MRKKPDLLWVLVLIFSLGVVVSGYTHSRGLAGGPDLPSVTMGKLLLESEADHPSSRL